MSYYAMYNILLGLLFKIGIKCENHSGAILLTKRLLEKEQLYTIISYAKKERIDKQYYVNTQDKITKKIAQELYTQAEDFMLETKTIMQQLNNETITMLRKKIEEL